MNIVILGAAGFLGINLVKRLAEDIENKILAVDYNLDFFNGEFRNSSSVTCEAFEFSKDADFDKILSGQEIVYHLVSTNMPSTSNKKISDELEANIISTARMLEACVRQKIKKVVFISSGGTVYGKDIMCPIKEDSRKQPITSYGLQKFTIENLLFLFNHVYGIEYKVLRLANPYGPYQRPNGLLGAVTNFTFNAIKGFPLTIFGDGKVVRDYIYIDDAITAIVNVSMNVTQYNIYNIGSGQGTDLNTLVGLIKNSVEKDLEITYLDSRSVDVPENYLDVSRYVEEFGEIVKVDLQEGIKRTADYLSAKYSD